MTHERNFWPAIGLTAFITAVLVAIALFGPGPIVETSIAQSGPATPDPSAEAGRQRLESSLYRSCRNTRKLFTVNGAPVGYTGKCIGKGVRISDCYYEWPKTAENPGHRLKVRCSGWIMWQVTEYTVGGPCFSVVLARGLAFPGTIITAWRTGRTFYKKDGTLGLKVNNWEACNPGLA